MVFPMRRKYTSRVWQPRCTSKGKHPLFIRELMLLVWINEMHAFVNLFVWPALKETWLISLHTLIVWHKISDTFFSLLQCKSIWMYSIEISLYLHILGVSVSVYVFSSCAEVGSESEQMSTCEVLIFPVHMPKMPTPVHNCHHTFMQCCFSRWHCDI